MSDARTYAVRRLSKAEALDRLRSHPEALRVNDLLHWKAGAASVSGAIVRADPGEVWTATLGLPGWLALALDVLAMTAPTLDLGWEGAIDVFDALPETADLVHRPYALVAGCLDCETQSVLAWAQAADLRDCAVALAGLHRRACDGEPIGVEEWRTQRRRIADLTPETELDIACHLCLEAAAWDVSTSRTTVADTLRYWHLAVAKSMQYPWSEADHNRVKTRLDELHAAERKRVPEDVLIDVFKLLEIHSPDIAAELKESHETNARAAEVAWRYMRDRLAAGLGAA